jgi:hypothetical protein
MSTNDEINTGMEREDIMMRNQQLLALLRDRDKEIRKLEECIFHAWAIMVDYDGYYDPKTGKGDPKGLASTIDEAVAILKSHQPLTPQGD